jgi:hypothetical protein
MEAEHGEQFGPPEARTVLDRRGYAMQAQVARAIGPSVALLLLAGCSGGSGGGLPTVVLTTPASATQLSSDNPEIPGAPPPGPAMPATILTNPTPGPR